MIIHLVLPPRPLRFLARPLAYILTKTTVSRAILFKVCWTYFSRFQKARVDSHFLSIQFFADTRPLPPDNSLHRLNWGFRPNTA